MKQTYNFLIIITLMLLSNISFSQSVPSYVPTIGLVGWWGFNGNAQDGSGNGNHGFNITAQHIADRFGSLNSAYQLGGGVIQIPSTVFQFSRNSSFTVSLWFTHEATGNARLISTENNEGNFRIANASWSTIHGDFATQFGDYLFDTLANPHQWNHLVYTYSNRNEKTYINGNLTNTNYDIDNESLNYGSPLCIGAKASATGNDRWNGKFDDFGIWNRALTPQEITNLYNSQLPTQTSLCLPTITTSSPTSVGVDSVVISGDISNDGGSSIVLRGVCYSTTPNPNMGNSRTEDGSGIGSFNTVLRVLNPSTTYYAKSYAKNSNGVVVYGNEVSFSTSSINIGSNYAGGIVFYVDSTGQHGLVCAPSDQGVAEWGCNCFEIGGLSFSLGSGLTNTNRITSICLQTGIAAQICSNLELNGFMDWYLPSINELQLMWNNLRGTPNSPTPNLANFSTQSPYWSSSEPSNYPCYALAIDFWQGNMVTRNKYMGQNYGSRVRAIRSF